MTIREGVPGEINSGDEGIPSEMLCGFIKVALVAAALVGAFGLLSGWFGGVAFDGADLMNLLGGSR